MTLRMAKIVGDRAEDIAKSALWAAASRIGVPAILALLLIGIPAHLTWAGRINEELSIAKREIAAVIVDVKAIKDAARADREKDRDRETSMATNLASVTANVAAILRSIEKIEKDLRAPGR